MRPSLSIRVLTSILYLIILNIVLIALNWGIGVFLTFVMIPVFDWFNDLSLWLKIVLFITGVTGFATLLMNIFSIIPALLSAFIQSYLYISTTIIVMSRVFVIGNIIYSLIHLGRVFESLEGFWIWVEFLMLMYFIIRVNSLFIMRKLVNS